MAVSKQAGSKYSSKDSLNLSENFAHWRNMDYGNETLAGDFSDIKNETSYFF